MLGHYTSLALCVAGALLGAPTLAAAQGQVRDGFYFQPSLGLGFYSSSAEALGATISYSGMTMATQLLLGGTIFEGLAVGGGLLLDYGMSVTGTMEYAGMSTSTELQDVSQFVVGLLLFADYYLPMVEGLHIQVLGGWGGLETSYQGNAGGSDPTGLMLSLGAGYEWWLSEEWSVGVLGRLVYAPLSLNDIGYTTIAPAIAATLTY